MSDSTLRSLGEAYNARAERHAAQEAATQLAQLVLHDTVAYARDHQIIAHTVQRLNDGRIALPCDIWQLNPPQKTGILARRTTTTPELWHTQTKPTGKPLVEEAGIYEKGSETGNLSQLSKQLAQRTLVISACRGVDSECLQGLTTRQILRITEGDSHLTDDRHMGFGVAMEGLVPEWNSADPTLALRLVDALNRELPGLREGVPYKIATTAAMGFAAAKLNPNTQRFDYTV